ncbi:hypothetical protein BD626DRAFT_446701 [Schizophyllum amplum]|uniref:Uncharacterized protein n=1 Tax=Schizophyllum amplum TaxID=97359 RepID=A0A550CW73_9AGAR|nr:hypothetical protein BD626DRAFT_446701 [Auriculariopsis ampla]
MSRSLPTFARSCDTLLHRNLLTTGTRSCFRIALASRQQHRSFTSTNLRRQKTAEETGTLTPPSELSHDKLEEVLTYRGPLAATMRRLKYVTMSTLTLTSAAIPIMFLTQSSLSPLALVSLTGTVLATSGISTGLVAWGCGPYVSRLRKLREPEAGTEVVEMSTWSVFLRERTTKVYMTDALVKTERPLATWMLAPYIQRPPESVVIGTEQVVAETLNDKGEVIGRWLVVWGEEGMGVCREVGKVIRHFYVHEELLH